MKRLPIFATSTVLLFSAISGACATSSQPPAAVNPATAVIDGTHLYGPFNLRTSDFSPPIVRRCGDVSESPAEMLFEGSATLDGTTCVENDGLDVLLQAEATPTHAPVLGIDIPF